MLRLISILLLSINCLSQTRQLIIKGSNITLSTGTYIVPENFSYDFGNADVTILGVAGKTIIKCRNTFAPVSINTNSPDTFSSGVYVVAQHPVYSYGGGFAHLKLPYKTVDTAVYYTMGTVLVKSKGLWSRQYTGFGFKTTGSITVKNIIFQDCPFYLFSPYSQNIIASKFELINCQFKNIARVIGSCTYAGINQSKEWFTNLSVYNAWGIMRFKNFVVRNCTFDNIYTSIVWGFPPSDTVNISGNIIKNCSTMIAAFNLFVNDYYDQNYWKQRIVQNITGNKFENITNYNGYTTALIRTSGQANMSNNTIVNCSPQAVLIAGGNSILSGNIISKYYDNTGIQSPVYLIKTNNADIEFTGDSVQAKQSIYVAIEGNANVSISSCDLSVKTVYSKNDATDGSNQSLTISGNNINSPYITNISSKQQTSFKSVRIFDNKISGMVLMNTGVAKVLEYLFSNNSLK